MTKDLGTKGWNRDVYTFINILLSSYRENEIFEQLVEYFIYLNDIRNVETIQDYQIPYFANIFRTFHNLIEKPIAYDERDYQDFLKRCNEIHEKKEKKNSEYKSKLKERIQNMIADYGEKGIELNEEEIVEAIKNQIRKEKENGERSE